MNRPAFERVERAQDRVRRFMDETRAKQKQVAGLIGTSAPTMTRFLNSPEDLSDDLLMKVVVGIEEVTRQARDVLITARDEFVPAGEGQHDAELINLHKSLIAQVRESASEEATAPFVSGQTLHSLTVSLPDGVRLKGAYRWASTLMFSAWAIDAGEMPSDVIERGLRWCDELREAGLDDGAIAGASAWPQRLCDAGASDEDVLRSQDPSLFPDRLRLYTDHAAFALHRLRNDRGAMLETARRMAEVATRSREADDGFWANTLRNLDHLLTTKVRGAEELSRDVARLALAHPSESLDFALLNKEIRGVIAHWWTVEPDVLRRVGVAGETPRVETKRAHPMWPTLVASAALMLCAAALFIGPDGKDDPTRTLVDGKDGPKRVQVETKLADGKDRPKRVVRLA